MTKSTTKEPAVRKERRTAKQVLTEPTTWAGLLTAACAVATGGASALTDPVIWGQIGAGLALVFAREG